MSPGSALVPPATEQMQDSRGSSNSPPWLFRSLLSDFRIIFPFSEKGFSHDTLLGNLNSINESGQRDGGEKSGYLSEGRGSEAGTYRGCLETPHYLKHLVLRGAALQPWGQALNIYISPVSLRAEIHSESGGWFPQAG